MVTPFKIVDVVGHRRYEVNIAIQRPCILWNSLSRFLSASPLSRSLKNTSLIKLLAMALKFHLQLHNHGSHEKPGNSSVNTSLSCCQPMNMRRPRGDGDGLSRCCWGRSSSVGKSLRVYIPSATPEVLQTELACG